MTIDDDDDEEDRDLNPILIPPTPAKSKSQRLFVTSPLNPRAKEGGDLANDKGDTKASSFNHLMIPLPSIVKLKNILDNIKIPKSFRKKKKGGHQFLPIMESPFEVLATSKMKIIKKQKGCCVETSAPSKSQDADTATNDASSSPKENYQTTYWKKKAATHKEQEREAQEERERIRQGKETPEESLLRTRALSLRDEMNAWKARSGTGEYDEGTIQANIDQLERDFYGIDFKYRP
ncbi:MAG: hypothetical protein WC612_07660 [Bdellovibrionales bacterium]|jgi:hypothetical protein